MSLEAPLFDRARAYAAQVTGQATSTLLDFSNVMQGLERLSTIEQRALAVRQQFQILVDAGAATERDYRMFDQLRGYVWSAQMAYRTRVIQMLAQIGMADQIPNVPMPALMLSVLRSSPTPAGVRGLQGLGAVPPPPPAFFFAGAVIALITALAIVAAVVAIGLGVYEVASVFIAEIELQKLEAFYSARIACLQAGHSVAECTGIVPAPPSAPSRDSGISTIAWALGGLAAVTIGILGIVKLGSKGASS